MFKVEEKPTCSYLWGGKKNLLKKYKYKKQTTEKEKKL